MTWEEYGASVVARARAKKRPMESIVLGKSRQLLVDNWLIAHCENLNRTLHQPVKDTRNPLIRPESPWEQSISWSSVIWDEEEAVFKAWYQNYQADRLLYAVSQDGISWEKPSLGVVECDGGKDNNIVFSTRGMDSPSVIKDVHDPDPGRRYKLLAQWADPVYGLYVGFSEDGKAWRIGETPVLTPANDPAINDRPTVMQDHVGRRFIAITKREIANPFGRGDWGFYHRSRAISVSRDFETWTDPVLTLHPDDSDPPDLQIYGLVGFNYESTYLGLMDMYWSRESGPKERIIDVQLALSRDGEVWWRAGNRNTFLPVGPDNAWDRYLVAPTNSQPTLMGDEIWIYYRGQGAHRHRKGIAEHRRKDPWHVPGHPRDSALEPGTPTSGIGLARLRRDGFVSLDAGTKPGLLLTRPLHFEGKELHLNADAASGSVRAELYRAVEVPFKYPGQNWTIGKPIPGYALTDCLPIRENTTDSVLCWKNRKTLADLAKYPLVIRFELVQSALYAFWFV